MYKYSFHGNGPLKRLFPPLYSFVFVSYYFTTFSFVVIYVNVDI